MMSNIQHGFYSRNETVNPDSRMLSAAELSLELMSLAESYLFGEEVTDPILAHNVIKAVYQGGRFKFPTLFEKAEKYCTKNYEFAAMEKLANS